MNTQETKISLMKALKSAIDGTMFTLPLQMANDIIEYKGERFRVSLHNVSEREGVAPYQPKLKLRIFHDSNASDPRKDFDNLGVMFCKHNRYNLGDKDADDPIIEYRFAQLDTRAIEILRHAGFYNAPEHSADDSRIYDCENCPDDARTDAYLETFIAECVDGMLSDEDVEHLYRVIRYPAPWEVEHVERKDIALCIPLYLYDHSGITISHGAFSCPWDSGQVGWHYITWKALEDNWPDKSLESARRCLEAELEEYDNYLRGNVYCFVIEDENGDVVDSCGGYSGYDWKANGLADNIPEEVKDQLDDVEIEYER